MARARSVRPAPSLALLATFAAVLGVAAVLLRPLSVTALDLPPSQEGVAVYDLAGIWSEATRTQAQAIADGIRSRTQAQLAIVSWPSDVYDVDTGTAKADAITIMDTWGVGRKGVNDGLVVLFDMDHGSHEHGQIYLYAGSGYIDQYLNPDEAASIVNGDMLPKARDGDLDGSLLAGLRKVDAATQVGGNPDRKLQPIFHALLIGALLGGAGIVFGLFLMAWWERGRDARVVMIDDSVLLPTPPQRLTPALATALRHDGVDKESFTSALVDLGHRGLVTFEQRSDKKHVDLVVPGEPLVDPNSLEARRRPLGTAEEHLAERIAAKADNGVLSWSDLKRGEGAKLYESFKKDLGHAAAASGWFRDDPNAITGRWTAIGIAVIVGVVLFGFFFAFDTGDNDQLFKPGTDYLAIPLLVAGLLGLAIVVLSRFLAARTEDGARTLAMALAYRNTLRHEIGTSHTVDEAVDKTKSRLPWITTPDLLTVWAVAFGLKDDIDALIKETFETAKAAGTTAWSPAWYTGSGGVSSVSSLSGMIGSIGTTAASSSGGGYGGGSSGGGGGAGGGF